MTGRAAATRSRRELLAYRVLGLVLLAWLVACGPAEGTAGRPGAVRAPHEVTLDPAPLDARPWLASVAKTAAAAGAGALQPVAAAVAAEGDRVGGFVRVAAGDCLLGIARTSATIQDADLFVFSEGGDLLASDEAPSAEAAVLLCPPHPQRVYLAARVASGTGVVAVGAMPVSPDAASAVGRVVAVRGRAGTDTGKLDSWPGLEAKLRERRAELGSGWQELRRVLLPVDSHAVSALSTPVEAGRCVDVLGVPADEVEGLELVATDGRGRIVARGAEHGRDRRMMVCAESDQALNLQLRPTASSGLVVVVVSRSPTGLAARPAGAVSLDAPAAAPPLDEVLERHHTALGRLGWGPAVAAGSGTAAVGTAISQTLTLASGCSRIDVLGGAPLRGVVVELWSAEGERLANGRGSEVGPVFHCGLGRRVQVEVSAEAAPGPFAIELRHDAAPPKQVLDRPLAAARLLSRLEPLVGPVDARLLASSQPLALPRDAKQLLPLSVAPRRCVLLGASLDGAASGLELRIVDEPTGQPLEARDDAVVVERLCAAGEPRQARLELRSLGGEARGLLLRLDRPATAFGASQR